MGVDKKRTKATLEFTWDMGCIPSKKEVVPKKAKKGKKKPRGNITNVLPAEGALTEDEELEVLCEEVNFELAGGLSQEQKNEVKRILAKNSANASCRTRKELEDSELFERDSARSAGKRNMATPKYNQSVSRKSEVGSVRMGSIGQSVSRRSRDSRSSHRSAGDNRGSLQIILENIIQHRKAEYHHKSTEAEHRNTENERSNHST